MPSETFSTIAAEDLSRVAGGLTYNDQITSTLTQITNSLSQLSVGQSQSDPTDMLLLMMLMSSLGGGGGGGGGFFQSPGWSSGAPVVNVNASVNRGGGWFGPVYRPRSGW